MGGMPTGFLFDCIIVVTSFPAQLSTQKYWGAFRQTQFKNVLMSTPPPDETVFIRESAHLLDAASRSSWVWNLAFCERKGTATASLFATLAI